MSNDQARQRSEADAELERGAEIEEYLNRHVLESAGVLSEWWAYLTSGPTSRKRMSDPAGRSLQDGVGSQLLPLIEKLTAGETEGLPEG